MIKIDAARTFETAGSLSSPRPRVGLEPRSSVHSRSMAEDNNKYKVLVNCKMRLVDFFAAGDLSTIGQEFRSKSFIPPNLYSEIVDVASTAEAKAEKIAQAVTRTIKARPSKFEDLVEILKDQDMLDLTVILQGELSKFPIAILN